MAIIDAVSAPLPPATVIKLFPDELKKKEGHRCSLHDFNLLDTIELMRLRETLPEMIILGIIPQDTNRVNIGLSETLAGKFDGIVEKIEREIKVERE